MQLLARQSIRSFRLHVYLGWLSAGLSAQITSAGERGPILLGFGQEE